MAPPPALTPPLPPRPPTLRPAPRQLLNATIDREVVKAEFVKTSGGLRLRVQVGPGAGEGAWLLPSLTIELFLLRA